MRHQTIALYQLKKKFQKIGPWMKTFQTEFIFRLSKTEISICPKKLSPTTDNRPPKRQIRRICLFSVFPNFLIYFNPLFVYPFTHLSLKSEKPQQAAAAAVAAAAGGEFFSGGFFPSKIRIEWKSCFAFCLFWNVAIDRMWLFLFSFVLSFCRERLRIKIEIVEKNSSGGGRRRPLKEFFNAF